LEVQVNGKRAFATTGGCPFDSTRPTAVLIHGAGMDHTVWVLQARYIAYHGRNVLAVDLPGHGRSEGPALASIEEMAEWVGQFLHLMDISDAAVVGHSMGSLVAIELAARLPETVKSTVLLSTAMPMPVSDDLLNAAKANDHEAIDMITVWGHGRSSQLGGHKIPGLWMIGSAGRLLEQAAKSVLYADLNACHTYQDGLRTASCIRCPVLLMVGKDDRMTPPQASRALADVIPDCTIEIIEGCGHMMMIEKPDQVLDYMRDAF
tara:strand:- start:699 stop:1487 length:789 start_codon:yes stop_codon:yes gene_type:complete